MINIVIETNNSKLLKNKHALFLNKISNFSSDIEIDVNEDNIAFGVDETLLAGMYFIIESVKSGITYDLLKNIYEFSESYFKDQKGIAKINFYFKDIKTGKTAKFTLENVKKGKIKYDGIEIEFE